MEVEAVISLLFMSIVMSVYDIYLSLVLKTMLLGLWIFVAGDTNLYGLPVCTLV